MGKSLRILFIVVLILIFTFECNASEIDVEDFFNNAPDEFENSTVESAQDEVRLDAVFEKICSEFLIGFKNSMTLFFSIGGIVILFALFKNIQGDNRIYGNIVAVILPITVIAFSMPSLEKCISEIIKSIETAYIFCTSAVPTIVALCISSGNSLSGVAFSTTISFLASFLQKLSAQLLMPLTVVLLTFVVTNALSTNLNTISVEKQIKKFIKWLIGGFVTVFSMVISLQTFLSSASDTLLKRSIKNAVGSFIPIIGNTLSSSIDSVFVVASNTKTSLAVIGIIIIVTIFLPVIAMCVCNGAALSIAKIFCLFFNDQKSAGTISSIADVFYILSGICASCVIMMIFSFLMICININ